MDGTSGRLLGHTNPTTAVERMNATHDRWYDLALSVLTDGTDHRFGFDALTVLTGCLVRAGVIGM
jgi:hypothetical protein